MPLSFPLPGEPPLPTHTHSYSHVHMHTHTCASTGRLTYTLTHAFKHIHTQCTYAYSHSQMHAFTHTHSYLCAQTHTCTHSPLQCTHSCTCFTLPSHMRHSSLKPNFSCKLSILANEQEIHRPHHHLGCLDAVWWPGFVETNAALFWV